MTGSDREADAVLGGDDMLAVGVLTGTHGVGGDLKLKVFSGDSEHLRGVHEALFRGERGEKRLRLESVRPQPGAAIVKVADVATVEQARRLVGYEMWVPRAQAVPLGDGEYYTADLCRCRLLFGEEVIGPVVSVWDVGPTQLLEVRGKAGKTHLVPFTDHFIGVVDVGGRRIFLRMDEVVR